MTSMGTTIQLLTLDKTAMPGGRRAEELLSCSALTWITLQIGWKQQPTSSRNALNYDALPQVMISSPQPQPPLCHGLKSLKGHTI